MPSNLSVILKQLCLSEPRSLCLEVAAVFSRNYPDQGAEFAMILEGQASGNFSLAPVNTPSIAARLTQAHFKKKQRQEGAQLVPKELRSKTIFSGTEPEEPEAIEIPTTAFDTSEEMYKHFKTTDLAEIRAYIKENMGKIHAKASEEQTLKVINNLIAVANQASDEEE